MSCMYGTPTLTVGIVMMRDYRWLDAGRREIDLSFIDPVLVETRNSSSKLK